jgi:hypothetical protein
MDAQGLVHVDGNKVVKAGFGAGVGLLIQLGRLCHQAKHGFDVLLSRCVVDVAPKAI